MKFDLSGLPSGKVLTGVKLYLYCTVNDPKRPRYVQIDVNETADNWNGGNLTWNTAPAVGMFVASNTTVDGKNKWYSWNITSYAQAQYEGDKILSVVVRFPQDDPTQLPDLPHYHRDFASKNHTDLNKRPYLEITYEPLTPVNTPPVAVDDSYSTNEDTMLSVSALGVLGNDTDVDLDSLTAVLNSTVSHGLLTLNSNGSFTYTPDSDWNGVDSFTYRAWDSQDYSNIATVTITVNLVNDPPTPPVVDVTPDSPLTDYDLTCTVTTVSTDADGDTITYTYEWYRDTGSGFVLQPGLTTTTTALSVTIDSSNTAKGDVWKCVVTPNDGTANGPSGEDQVTIGNTPPSIDGVNITPDPAYTTDTLTAVPYGWSDPDGDPEGYLYQWQKWDGANWQDISGETSSTLGPDNFVKGEQIKVICTPFDGEDYGTPKEDTITISNSPPSAPVVDVIPDFPVTTDDLVCIITTPSIDPDGDEVTYTYEWYKNGKLQPDLTTNTVPASYTTEGDVWKCVVTPHGSAGPPGEDEVTIQNSPPVLGTIGDKSVDEETLLSFTATATDPDVPPQTLTFSLGLGAPPGASITSGGYFTWTPTEAQGPSVYDINITVSDGIAIDYEVITVTVNEVNVAPVLFPIGDTTVSEGALLRCAVTASDSDLPAQTLIYSASNLPPGATFNPDTSVFSWTPTSGQAGVYSGVHFEVSDGDLKDSENITITVTSGAPPPAVGGYALPINLDLGTSNSLIPQIGLASTLSAIVAATIILVRRRKKTLKR